MKFIVHIAETRNFDIPVDADTGAEAQAMAEKLWRETGDPSAWERSDASAEVISIMPQGGEK